MKNNFQTGVEIETMKRKVKSLGERNANEFKELALEYVELTDAALPKDFFNSLCGNYNSPPVPSKALLNQLHHIQLRRRIYSDTKLKNLLIYLVTKMKNL